MNAFNFITSKTLNFKKPLLGTLFVFLILVGIFAPVLNVQAQTPGQWYYERTGVVGGNVIEGPFNSFDECNAQAVRFTSIVRKCFTSATKPAVTAPGTATTQAVEAITKETADQKAVKSELDPGCAIITGDFDDCVVKITYILFGNPCVSIESKIPAVLLLSF